jgi:HlyD family secretion protein
MTEFMAARRKLIVLVVLGLLGAGLGYYHFASPDKAENGARYKTKPVDVGDIRQVITANGTLNPVVLVNVGTQVSGTVKALHADFNARVAPGQILAELDPALFRAALAQSQANLLKAQADLKLAKAKEARARDLLAKNFISQTAMDEAVQALDAAQAQEALARAQVERDSTNLHYSVIRSPISGVVVARNVDVGQTVAASFQTPTLFQIAKDLRDMQIDSSVAEADVGAIFVGQKVKFSVDAFPEREFVGKVRQIRLNPTIQQNVVTYNVVVAVDNEDCKLMPGMTAHVKISVAERKDVLRIPTAALRFKPDSGEEEGEKKPRANQRGDSPTVYRLGADKQLAPVKLKLGISDGTNTEVTAGDLKPGDALVLKDTAANKEKKKSSFQLRMF